MVCIRDMRVSVRLLLFACVMLVAPAAWSAESPRATPSNPDRQPEQAQRQQDQPLNNAPVWRDVRSGENPFQTTQVRGIETNVLIQSEGQLWREIRNGPITVYGGWALIVVLLLILAFTCGRGRSSFTASRPAARSSAFHRGIAPYTGP